MPSWRNYKSASSPDASQEPDEQLAVFLGSERVDRLLLNAESVLGINIEDFEGDFGLTSGFSARRT